MNDHNELKTLLPWFLNGSLNEGEQSRMAEHLKQCKQCQQDARDLVQIARRFHPKKDLAPVTEAARRSAADFMTTLDAATPRPRRNAIRLTTAAALLGCLALGLTLLLPPQDAYRTLGTSISGSNRDVVQIVFSATATEQSIREVLLANEKEVLSGPTRQGVYRVALGEDQRAEIVVARLRNHPDVIFAEHEVRP